MRLVFDLPLAGCVGLPLVLLVAGLLLWSRKRRGQSWPRIAATVGLRTAALLLLVGLAARPVWVAREAASAGHRPVAILVDRSESMSLEEGGKTRYERALGFAREQLLPALKAAGLPAQALLFAQDAVAESGEKIVTAIPDGKRTNLGGAIAQALANATEPPLAVIALTDGMANESADNNRALTGLVDGGVPFIGVGFGSDEGVPTLTLRNVDAPPVVSPKTTFNFAAQLEAVNGGSLPEFDLLLFRDDLLLRKKTVPAGKGSRMWQESFSLSEEQEGSHRYEVRLVPPDVRGLKCVNQTAGAAVRISQDRELRVLYIQGALTWDYKFVGMALRDDPAMKLTGLTRTSKQSIFRQNVESSGELVNGFPASLTEIAPFRVIVLSNLKPADLTTEQQEMLARFVGELGGGLLMIGGAATFDSSWQGSRLEQLLPVVFASGGGVQGLDRPFRLQLSDEALQQKFGRRLQNRSAPTFSFDADFQIESYLRHQGSTFVERFDANSYLYMTRAMDYFDLAADYGGKLRSAFHGTKSRICVVSFTSDWLFPTSESRSIVHALNASGASVSFVEIETEKGHDAFLLDIPELFKTTSGFLNSAAKARGLPPASK